MSKLKPSSGPTGDKLPSDDSSGLQPPIVAVAYGSGTNSTAMLIGWVSLGLPVRYITFSDTGGERPEVYDYLITFENWLVNRGAPPITVVGYRTRDGRDVSLEQRCLESKTLPSLAYGWKSCSEKFKVRPQNNFMRLQPDAQACWKRGQKIVKLIGYDAGETRRTFSVPNSDPRYEFRHPLIDWGMDRDDCKRLIEAVGLPQPGKSSCFFCPSARKPEIVELAIRHPDLAVRAMQIEANAKDGLTTVKGLGRRFSWTEFLAEKLKNGELIEPDVCDLEDAYEDGSDDLPCGCFDG
jgi:hypothetical protein